MEVNLNNRTEEIHTDEIQYFGQLMEKLSEQAAEVGDSVLSVRLNGEDITGKDRSNLEDLPLDDIEKLEVQTGDPRQLARSTLFSVAEFLEQLLKELQTTSDLFRMSRDDRSNESYLRSIDGLQVFMHTMETCRRLLGLSYELVTVPSADGFTEKTIAESRRSLFEVLDNMIDAQSDQDFVLLADLLEYELIPTLQDWRQIIPEILKLTQPNHAQVHEPEPVLELA